MAAERKNAQDRKAEIVDVAIRLAGQLGPDRVTTQQLADAIGISQPAIFRHFATKADIWLAVGKVIAVPVSEQYGGDVESGDNDPLTVLNALMARHLGQIVRTPAIPAILFSRELHVENESLRHHFETVMTKRRAGLARLISRAQAVGQLAEDVQPEDMAALLLAVVQGLAMRWSLENRGFDLVAEGTRLIGVQIRGMQGD